jgi:pyruvate ferredoxin oxidoreductase gamma subunit
MSDVIDTRIHGRGGQGTVTLAALLVDAAFGGGWNALGFPSFGTERTGAPVAAFVRMSTEPIRDRSEIRRPSIVVVQDPTLIEAVDVLEGLTANGLVLLNATEARPSLGDARVVSVPATELALQFLGVPKTSTAMLGLFAAATSLIPVDAVVDSIRRRFTGPVAENNERLARAAFAHVTDRSAA